MYKGLRDLLKILQSILDAWNETKEHFNIIEGSLEIKTNKKIDKNE